MNLIPVQSSNLKAVGFEQTDINEATLEVHFLNGTAYQYSGVEPEVFEALLAAPSVGQFFNKNIKNGGYPCTSINPQFGSKSAQMSVTT